MMLTFWYNRIAPAAVLVTLAGTDHQSKGSSTMAESIMPRMVHFRTEKPSHKDGCYKHTYECIECNACFTAYQSQVNAGRHRCLSCSARSRKSKLMIANTLHGMTGSKLHKIWVKMKERCTNKNADNYYAYGGRGISICNEWLSFDGFLEWAKQQDWKPGMQIDRIDNNGDYTPRNCRLATKAENCQNRRSTILSRNQIPVIRKMHAEGLSIGGIAKLMGVTESPIRGVVTGRTWRNV